MIFCFRFLQRSQLLHQLQQRSQNQQTVLQRVQLTQQQLQPHHHQQIQLQQYQWIQTARTCQVEMLRVTTFLHLPSTIAIEFHIWTMFCFR